MYKERLKKLFETFDPAVQSVILGVLEIEQEHISKDKPHVKDPIDEIVSYVAKRELENEKAQEHT